MLMSSCLLTITLNSPSTVLVYLNSTLQAEVNLPFEIPFGDSKLSSSLVVLKGTLSPEYLNLLFVYSFSVISRNLLGPVYYQTGSLPPSFNGMNSLIPPETSLFEWNAKKCSVHYRIDFTPKVLL